MLPPPASPADILGMVASLPTPVVFGTVAVATFALMCAVLAVYVFVSRNARGPRARTSEISLGAISRTVESTVSPLTVMQDPGKQQAIAMSELNPAAAALPLQLPQRRQPAACGHS